MFCVGTIPVGGTLYRGCGGGGVLEKAFGHSSSVSAAASLPIP